MITESTKTMSMEMETSQLSEDPGAKIATMASGGGYLVDHMDLREGLEDFLSLTIDARAISERCRDYKDGKQWSSEQVAALKRRKQAPIVNNRIKIKHNGLLGLTSLRRGDPKAYPRNVDTDSKSSEAVTDGLRYAADRIALNGTFLETADSFFCEGYCAALS